MISTILQGRTGNQMFQIAAAYAHAKRHGFDYCIPPHSANENLWPSHRWQVKYGAFKGKLYNEPRFCFDEIPAEDNLVLNGYFQSLKYFEDYSEELCDIFGFEEKMMPGTVAVHVRRGDYINYKDQFNLLQPSWYRDAMGGMTDTYGDELEFHFYSDDIEFCKRKFPGHIYHSGHPLQDMRMAAQHEHCIMSASSFSWWIAHNVSGSVIAPATWFGPKNQHHNTKDLYQPSWIKI